MSTSPTRSSPAASRTTARPALAKKAARKTPARPAPASKPTATPAATAPAVVPAPPSVGSDKAPKAKLVRDSFTIPADEYAELDRLKQRALKLAHPAKKSELLRAGIKALVALPDAALLAALRAVPAIKTGRPKSRKSDKPEKADRSTSKKRV